jgi:hypothetical protein
MSIWTAPRAYVAGMTSQQTRELTKLESAKAQAAYSNHVAKLVALHSKK